MKCGKTSYPWFSYFYYSIVPLTYRQNLKWRPMPDKMAEKLVTPNIVSARNQWYSKDSVFWLAKITLFVWRNVNSRIFVGHRTSFPAVCRYVNSIFRPGRHACVNGQYNWLCSHTIWDLSYFGYTKAVNQNFSEDTFYNLKQPKLFHVTFSLPRPICLVLCVSYCVNCFFCTGHFAMLPLNFTLPALPAVFPFSLIFCKIHFIFTRRR